MQIICNALIYLKEDKEMASYSLEQLGPSTVFQAAMTPHNSVYF